jgi:pimeloyl-ACP methyl ester carboxylesterase
MQAADDASARFTPSGVRLRAHVRRPGALDWLFLPGGPGLGSESLGGLVDAARVPGTSWLVDMPGDGSNVDAPGAPADPYALWPDVLVEAARAVARPVFVGHSMAGMYLLAVPELEELLLGLALISSAPDSSWLPAFFELARRHPLPGVAEATARFEADPSNENLRAISVLSAGYNFGSGFVEAGAGLLSRLPYNLAAVEWSAEHFEPTYGARWWPRDLPTLIVSGSDDRIVDQTLWDEERFNGPNIIRRRIDGGAHFPWIERPEAVREALAALTERLPVQSSRS